MPTHINSSHVFSVLAMHTVHTTSNTNNNTSNATICTSNMYSTYYMTRCQVMLSWEKPDHTTMVILKCNITLAHKSFSNKGYHSIE